MRLNVYLYFLQIYKFYYYFYYSFDNLFYYRSSHLHR